MFKKYRNKNLGTKISKIRKQKLQRSRNKTKIWEKYYKNPGSKVTKIRNKNFKNPGTNVKKNLGTNVKKI
jgi:hypothetical protein